MPTIERRSSGILLHISSLPGPYGTGDLGGAPAFVDFLAAAGQTYWQVLPLGPTSPVFGNSPYMS
ncbi:MAG TPA: 4-alpha-glucanotransferase, partial [Desulfobacteraceae bacterium]|nr:4-alpha-glucanotransferase [Desulfobacteraceae bacterium]